MDENNKNFFIAIFLSMGILFLWQYFVAGPQLEADKIRRQKIEAMKKAEDLKNAPGLLPSVNGKAKSGSINPSVALPREQVLKSGKRVKINTRHVSGSISLVGARIDDVVLETYRESLKKDSKRVVLLSPAGSKAPYYAEHGWYQPEGSTTKLPDSNTTWVLEEGKVLTQDTPITLKYDNGQGLVFHRTIGLDANYMFTISQQVENNTGKAVTLYPRAVVTRVGIPKIEGFFVLHEGMVGVLGEEGLQELGYDELLKSKPLDFSAQSGWLGITDKYWAAVIIPEQKTSYKARFSAQPGVVTPTFNTEYLLAGMTVPAGGKASTKGHFFAGAKKSALIDKYEKQLNIKSFDLMIDWGWFYFITKPIFWLINWFYHLFGNFGVSILLTTLVIKGLFFPLASKAYVSMGKMKKLQPEVLKLKERYKDDPMKNQQAMMALYKKEQVSPLSGCLPVLLQIPVFFALYKVLFVTIEMRHAPFFGWIQDLSAKDPTSPVNLFGLLPFDPPSFLVLGIWPIIMGITMWVQMQLNPAQADPIQQKIFTWMPVVFTIMLASFPAGLVIYWAWNNLLTIIQQSYIMKREGAEINLAENMGLDKLWAMVKGKIGTKSD